LWPEATAAIHNGRSLDYGQLRRRSDALAMRLREAGVRHGDKVGVCGSRGLDALVAFLGVLKSGAAYVALDDDSRPERRQALAEDADIQVAVLLPGSVCRLRRLRTRVAIAPILGHGAAHVGSSSWSETSESTAAQPTDRAYVTATSGSTGRPKAVAITHAGVVALAASDCVGTAATPA